MKKQQRMQWLAHLVLDFSGHISYAENIKIQKSKYIVHMIR